MDALYYFTAKDAARVAHCVVAYLSLLGVEQAASLNRANHEAGLVNFGHADHLDIACAQLGDCGGVGGVHGVLLFVDGPNIWA